MRKLRTLLTLRYVLLVTSVYVLVILPLHAIPSVRHVWWMLLLTFAGFLLLAMAMSIWTERTILRGLAKVREATARMVAGDFDRRMAEPDIEEFSSLARDFNAMGEQVRRRVEEKAAERGKLQAVLNNISTGVMVTDSESHIVMLNPAAQEILGVGQERGEGRRIIEVFSNRELDIAVGRAAGGDSVDEEIELLYPRRMLMHVKANPVIGVDGSVIATVSAIEDISALKRLGQVRQDFVANVSHELRTPVATIKAITDSLVDGAMEERETAENFLRDLEREVNRLSQLTEDLLRLSRLEAEETELRLEDIRARDLLRECLESKAKLAKEYHVDLEMTMADGDAVIRGDRRLLQTALDNLIDNAIKYNREGGKIHLSERLEDLGITIEVTDTGIGIPREELPRIFERFYRIDKARSRETGGTGLGLSIVKHVAELHGGMVDVSSVEGEGSTFRMHLPSARR